MLEGHIINNTTLIVEEVGSLLDSLLTTNQMLLANVTNLFGKEHLATTNNPLKFTSNEMEICLWVSVEKFIYLERIIIELSFIFEFIPRTIRWDWIFEIERFIS